MAMNSAIGPEHDPLLVRAGEADAIDEGGHAHDGRGQCVAGQQADQDGAAEDRLREQAQVQERLLHAQHAQDGRAAGDERDDRGDGDDGNARLRFVADERDRQQARGESRAEEDGPDRVHARGTRLDIPLGRGCPHVDGSQQSQRDGDVEDPAPGRDEVVDRGATPDADRGERIAQVEPAQDERTQQRADGHPQEGGGADEAERPRAGVAAVEVARAGRGERQDGAGAGALDDAAEDEHLQGGGGAADERPECEQQQRQDHQPRQAETVCRAPSQRHGRDVGHEIGRDDPGSAAQLVPAR